MLHKRILELQVEFINQRKQTLVGGREVERKGRLSRQPQLFFPPLYPPIAHSNLWPIVPHCVSVVSFMEAFKKKKKKKKPCHPKSISIVSEPKLISVTLWYPSQRPAPITRPATSAKSTLREKEAAEMHLASIQKHKLHISMSFEWLNCSNHMNASLAHHLCLHFASGSAWVSFRMKHILQSPM